MGSEMSAENANAYTSAYRCTVDPFPKNSHEFYGDPVGVAVAFKNRHIKRRDFAISKISTLNIMLYTDKFRYAFIHVCFALYLLQHS